MEIFLTVISGVLVFVLGQIINTFYLQPLNRQRETIGKISDAIIYYANLYTSPINKADSNFDRKEERSKAHEIFRNLAAELVSRTQQIPSYQALSSLRIVINKKVIVEARKNLIGLSNGMWPGHDDLEHNNRRREQLESQLNLIAE